MHISYVKQIYVVRFNKTVNKEDFKDLLNKIKEIGGYYSKFKRGFVFNDNPEDKLKGLINKYEGVEKETVEKNQSTKSDKVKAINYDKLEEKIMSVIKTTCQKYLDSLNIKELSERVLQDRAKEKLVKKKN